MVYDIRRVLVARRTYTYSSVRSVVCLFVFVFPALILPHSHMCFASSFLLLFLHQNFSCRFDSSSGSIRSPWNMTESLPASVVSSAAVPLMSISQPQRFFHCTDDASIRNMIRNISSEEREHVLATLGPDYTNAFHTVGFCDKRPVQILSPFDIEPGPQRRAFLETLASVSHISVPQIKIVATRLFPRCRSTTANHLCFHSQSIIYLFCQHTARSQRHDS